MKIVVPIKRVADPDHANKVAVSSDGKELKAEGLEFKINPYDEYALEAALRLTENAATKERIGETVVVTLGAADVTATLQQALAMGADRAIHVEADESQLDAFVVARALAKIVREEEPHLVLMGKLSVESESNACGQILAELLQWPMATHTQRLETTDNGASFIVGREVDLGEIVLKVKGPAVVTAADRILAPTAVRNGVTPSDYAYPQSDGGRYASLKGIMAAKKKPIAKRTLDDLEIDTARTTEYVRHDKPAGRSGQAVFVESAAELVAKLRDEAKVL